MSNPTVVKYQAIREEMRDKPPLTISIKPEFLYLVLTIVMDAIFALPLLPATKTDMLAWIQEANKKLKEASPTAHDLLENRISTEHKGV